MIKQFITAFYLCIIFILVRDAHIYLNVPNTTLDFQSFATILNFVENKRLIFKPIFISAVVLSVISIFYKRNILLSITNIMLLLAFSLQFSFGKINHNHHGWLICLILFSFLNINGALKSRRNYYIIRVTQGLILSHYLISGIWKLRNIIKDPPLSLAGLGLEHISYAIAEGGGGSSLVLGYLFKFPLIISVGFVSVLCFQLGCIIPIIRMKGYLLWGILSIFFHVSTGLTLGIWFKSNIVVILLILITLELMLGKQGLRES